MLSSQTSHVMSHFTVYHSWHRINYRGDIDSKGNFQGQWQSSMIYANSIGIALWYNFFNFNPTWFVILLCPKNLNQSSSNDLIPKRIQTMKDRIHE